MRQEMLAFLRSRGVRRFNEQCSVRQESRWREGIPKLRKMSGKPQAALMKDQAGIGLFFQPPLFQDPVEEFSDMIHVSESSRYAGLPTGETWHPPLGLFAVG